MTSRIDAPPKRTDDKPCPNCDCSAKGCRSYEWLAGSRCCKACPPHGHDEEATK